MNISELTLEEKARLLCGVGSWATKGYESKGVPSIRMNDGPHGLRVQEQEKVGNINDSHLATCFPTACATACSWDVELIKKLGNAIADEALAEKVSIVLGPGINIKRSPLCGRNFEYFSEDPYLAGRLSSAFVDGIQEKHVGTSLKHFAVNNQETRRMTVNALVDERALREIYLSAFEYVVKESQPTTIMACYNKVNGTYGTQNKYLLTDILRKEWGFEGLVVSDWGATNDIVECIRAGMDLEMPDSWGNNTRKLIKAVNDGILSMEELDRAVANVIKLVTERNKYVVNSTVDYAKNHIIAKEIAEECGVLLKNEDILPLKKEQKVLVVGSMAEKMRFQGNGSSHINTAVTPNLIDAMKFENAKFVYAQGYTQENDVIDTELENEALCLATSCDVVVFCGGLPDWFEGEGYDRTVLDMPTCQTTLITKLAKVNPNIIVVLFAGSPIVMPWLDNAKGLLHMYLSGQGVGEATYNLLYGVKNPCGKLAETYPQKLLDTPCYNYFGSSKRMSVDMKESIFVGYRYYDTYDVPTLFDFGYGLSYTDFKYSNLKITKNNIYNYTVSVTVNNIGKVAGKEIVELYIVAPVSDMLRAKRELKGFVKTDLLMPNESQTINFHLDKRSFAFYDVASKDWEVPQGDYIIELSKSLHNPQLSQVLSVEGVVVPSDKERYAEYFNQTNKTFTISDEQFAKLYGAIPVADVDAPKGKFTTANTLEEIAPHSPLARTILRAYERNVLKAVGGDRNSPVFKMTYYGAKETPLHTIPTMTGNAIKMKHIRAIVNFANGKFFRAIGELLGKDK